MRDNACQYVKFQKVKKKVNTESKPLVLSAWQLQKSPINSGAAFTGRKF